MVHQLEGEYKRIRLTPLTLAESEFLRVLRNKNRRWFLHQGEISQENQIKWYNGYLAKSNDLMFSVYHKRSGRWIGAAALYNINHAQNKAEFGRLVIDGARVDEKGLGLETTVCTCNLGFEKLGLSKITLEVYKDNIPALKTYENAGFTATASTRDIVFMELNHFKEG